MPPHVGQEQETEEQGLQQLSEWVSKQPHLPQIPSKLLSQILFSCYGSVERTKATVESFCTICTHAPELFRKIDPFDSEYEKGMQIMYACHMERANKAGESAVLIKFQDTDTRKFDFLAVLRAGVAAFFMLLDRHGRAPGFHALFDFSGVTMSHIMRVSLTTLKQLVTFVQEALPIRLKGIHFINSTPIVQNVTNLVKPLMKKELTEIFHVHTVETMPNFYAKFVDQAVMPLEYGGAGKRVHEMHDYILQATRASVDLLRELDGLDVDESKRVGESRTSSEIFGIQGSFKKLDLD